MKNKILGLLGALFVMSATASFGQVTQKAPQLINVSCRSRVSATDSRTAGFVIESMPGAPINASKQLLIRGVGPGLVPFGVTGVISDPKIVLYQNGRQIAENDNWETSSAVIAATNQAGAFNLPNGSRDAVISINVNVPANSVSNFTVTLSGAGNESGVSLIEVYDVQRDTGALRIINLSVLGSVGEGSDALIVGYTTDGGGARNMLVRAVGPELGQFGVVNFMFDPFLTFRYQSAANVFTTVTNDNWSGADTLNATARAGAFSLVQGSRSAALVISTVTTGLTSASAITTVSAGSPSGQPAGGKVLFEIYSVN